MIWRSHWSYTRQARLATALLQSRSRRQVLVARRCPVLVSREGYRSHWLLIGEQRWDISIHLESVAMVSVRPTVTLSRSVPVCRSSGVVHPHDPRDHQTGIVGRTRSRCLRRSTRSFCAFVVRRVIVNEQFLWWIVL